MESILSMIILLPLLGFVFTGLLRNKLSKNILGIFSSGTILIAFGLAVKLFFTLTGSVQKSFNHTYFDWIKAGDIVIPFNIQLDPLSILMTLIITGIGFLIHIYSIGYMHEDEGFGRFFAYLNLFIFFMLLLVLGGNLLITFIGWEGVGLCSFLLIGFWFKTPEYNAAAAKAFIMNRIGDLGLLAGMFLILFHFGTLNYSELFVKIQAFQNIDILSLIALFLFIGAIGKSAQLPLYTWLPDAMAGPTPVSALIHAATMVTAGVFLIARFNVLYNLTPMVQHLICYVGIITSIFAGIIGLKQTDIKKVLAYSTVSQLGLMFLAIGTGAYGVAMFHITTHAFFKALLFLTSGSVIHGMHGEQNMIKMGGLRKLMPITWASMLIGSLAISGIPPFAGFFSKDQILAVVYAHNPVLFALAFVASMITTFYMFRLMFLTFSNAFRSDEGVKSKVHESPLIMTVPLGVLAILSIIGGFMGVPAILGGNNNFMHFLAPVVGEMHHSEIPHNIEMMLMGIAVLGACFFIGLSFYIYRINKLIPSDDTKSMNPIAKLVYNKFYLDEIYNVIIIKPIKTASYVFYEFIEKYVIDFAVNGVAKIVNLSGVMIRILQSGSLSAYLFIMVFGILVFLVLQGFVFN